MTNTVVSIGIFLTVITVASAAAPRMVYMYDDLEDADYLMVQDLARNGIATHKGESRDINDVLKKLNATTSQWMSATVQGCRSTQLFGGSTGGGYFSMGCPSSPLTKIELWSSSKVIRGIKTNYDHRVFGETQNTHSSIDLRSGEKIIAAVVKTGKYAGGIRVKQLAFLTLYNNAVHQFGPFGEASGDGAVHVVAKHIVSFKGRSGADLDAIGFYYSD